MACRMVRRGRTDSAVGSPTGRHTDKPVDASNKGSDRSADGMSMGRRACGRCNFGAAALSVSKGFALSATELRPDSAPRWAALATATKTHRPRSSTGAGRGRRVRRSNWPRWSGLVVQQPPRPSRRPKPRPTAGASKRSVRPSEPCRAGGAARRLSSWTVVPDRARRGQATRPQDVACGRPFGSVACPPLPGVCLRPDAPRLPTADCKKGTPSSRIPNRQRATITARPKNQSASSQRASSRAGAVRVQCAPGLSAVCPTLSALAGGSCVMRMASRFNFWRFMSHALS
jgi:hypothetical protein